MTPFSALPFLELTGNRRIVIAARCEITLYSPQEMRVRTKKLGITVTGDELELETLDTEELSIGGTIACVTFTTED